MEGVGARRVSKMMLVLALKGWVGVQLPDELGRDFWTLGQKGTALQNTFCTCK